MNILFFTIFDYPHIGGMSTHMQMLIDGIKNKNNNVKSLSFSDINKLIYYTIVAGPHKIIKKISLEKSTKWVFLTKEFLLGLKMKRLLKTHSYGIVNCQDVLAAKIALKYKKKYNYEVILTVHGYFVMQTISNGQLKNDSKITEQFISIEKEVYEKVDKIITVDNRISEYIKEISNRKSNIWVVQNFVDIDKFNIDKDISADLRLKWGIDKDKFIVFCPRRMVHKNGVVYPALAMKNLIEEDDILLIYAGSGPEKENIISIIKEHNLEEKVMMLGDINYSEIPELFTLSDVVVIPSINSEGVEEATSISAIEGMASEKVVIASNIGGLKELIVNGSNGILIDQKRPDQISNEILNVKKNIGYRKGIEKNARMTVEKVFNLSIKIDEYLEIFRSGAD